MVKNTVIKPNSTSIAASVNEKNHAAKVEDRKTSQGRSNPLWHSLAMFSEPIIQAKSQADATTQTQIPTSIQTSIQSAGNGAPLNESVRSRVEPVLGHNLSAVRVHQGPAAEAATESINAKAFTHQNNIYLGKNQSASDLALMAHEATHVVQQKSTGNLIQRKSLQEELDTELAAWASKEGHSLDPKDKGYAFTLREYARLLTYDEGEVRPRQKPKKKSEVKKWEKDFKKISLLAKMIMKAGKVDQKETRASMIGQDLAQVGLIDDAMETAALLTDKDEKELIYALVLRSASQAKESHVITVTKFFTTGKDIHNNPVIDKLEGNQGVFAKALGSKKLNGVLDVLIGAYKNEDKMIATLSEILVFNSSLRKAFSDWMWTKDKDFLFKVVDSDFFVEPGYGGEAFADETGKAREMDMKKDMPWVYEVKQKYYVDYLIGLGVKASVAIPKPKNMKFQTLRAWLDQNTEKIGAALKALYPKDPDQITAVYEHIADIFFFHVDRGDVSPDLAGKLAKLGPSDPNKMRLKSDCDVLATYATRLLKSSGFTPIGYMAILPDSGVGHAVALLQQGTDYYIVNNKQVTKVSAKDKASAIIKLRNDGLTIYEDKPDSYKVYYADAAADGAMLASLRDTKESTRRTDLEP